MSVSQPDFHWYVPRVGKTKNPYEINQDQWHPPMGNAGTTGATTSPKSLFKLMKLPSARDIC
jgi:hypothetical protein